jgi:hypothetical protein
LLAGSYREIIAIETRFANGHPVRLPGLTAQLVDAEDTVLHQVIGDAGAWQYRTTATVSPE